jgi:hypothetical protein
MQFSTKKLEEARQNVVEAEQRLLRQRRRVEKMLVERHPADEAQAELLIMEQSLLSMVRFLKGLERDQETGAVSPERGVRRTQAKRTGGDAPQSPTTSENHG